MRALTIPAALVVLAGCAATPTMDDRIQAASYMDLCEAVYFAPPHISRHAAAEAQSRGINCRDHEQAVMVMRAQKEANRAAAAQILLSRPPFVYQPPSPMPTYQMPQRTTCRSRVVGNQVVTDCN